MANKDPYGMGIRLPTEMVEFLKKLRDEEGLPSMATAIKFWIEQQVAERQQTELQKLKEELARFQERTQILYDCVKKLIDNGENRDKWLRELCQGVHAILGRDELTKKLIPIGCGKTSECPMNDEPGLIDSLQFKPKETKTKTKDSVEHVK